MASIWSALISLYGRPSDPSFITPPAIDGAGPELPGERTGASDVGVAPLAIAYVLIMVLLSSWNHHRAWRT
jgi:hypothetical protein